MSASLTSATPIATESSTIPPGIVKITAPILFTPLINWALYGVLFVQIYVYSYNFPDDKFIVKSLACFVFLLETVQTALTGADVYYWFMEGFGSMEHLQHSHFAPIDIPILLAINSLIVQEYFCYRIWTLSSRRSPKLRYLCVIIALISVIQSVGALWGGISSLIVGKFAVSKTALYLWSVPSAISDILIAVAMTWLLSRVGGDGGQFSNFITLRLVRLTIETNALTAGVAITSFILYAAFPNEVYYVFTAGILGKIYSNTLLVSLNNRIYFRDHPTSGVHVDSDHLVETGDQFHRSATTSLRFAQVGSPTHTTARGDNIMLNTVSHTIGFDFEKGKGDAVSISSDPKSIRNEAHGSSDLR